MTSWGEPEPNERTDVRRPRTAAMLSLLAVAAGVATWAEVHYATPKPSSAAAVGQGSMSQDALAASGSLKAPVAAALPELDQVLPGQLSTPATATSPEGYRAVRYAEAAAGNCTGALATTATAAVRTSCIGSLTASYVSTDHTIVSSVTVLAYPDARTAKKAAASVAPTDVVFRLPGAALPDVVATAGPVPVFHPAAVGRYVTVVQTAHADGAPAHDPLLTTPTWFLSYTAGDALLWS